MTDLKYPNCRCERLFGLGQLCGDPDCDQVKDANENMRKLADELSKRFGGEGGLGETTFNLPDFRNK